jgi:hypothetical protein
VADEDDDAEDGHNGYKRADEGESTRRRRAACSPVNLSSSAEDRQERERGRDLRAAAAGIDVFHDERARLVHRSLTQARLVLSDLLPVGYVSESQSRRERNGSERKRWIEPLPAVGLTQVNGGFPRSSSSLHDKPITDSDGRPDGLQWATKFGYLLFGTVHILRLHLRKAVCIFCCHEAKFKQIQTSSSVDVGLRTAEPGLWHQSCTSCHAPPVKVCSPSNVVVLFSRQRQKSKLARPCARSRLGIGVRTYVKFEHEVS